MITTAIVTHFTKKCVQNSQLRPPSSLMVEETLGRLKDCYGHGKITVFYDSAPGETVYLDNLQRLCDQSGIALNVSHNQNYRRHMIHILGQIQTPYLFTLEHDWWIESAIDLGGIVSVMEACPWVNYVKLWNYHDQDERFKEPPLIEYFGHDLIGDRRDNLIERGLVRDTLWSTNPNVSRVEKWRSEWLPMISENDAHDANNGNAGGIEEQISQACFDDFKTLPFEEAHAKWGLYLKISPFPLVDHVGI